VAARLAVFKFMIRESSILSAFSHLFGRVDRLVNDHAAFLPRLSIERAEVKHEGVELLTSDAHGGARTLARAFSSARLERGACISEMRAQLA